MSWDYELARELKALGRRPGAGALLRGEVVRRAPLTISLYGGEVMAPPLSLQLTAWAAGMSWEAGECALCALVGKTLVVIDKLM